LGAESYDPQHEPSGTTAQDPKIAHDAPSSSSAERASLLIVEQYPTEVRNC
jgi:hypothetical protein